MWEGLIREREGRVVGEASATEARDGRFACVLVEDTEALPLIARLRDEPLVLQAKSGRVGGGEDAAGSLTVTASDAAAALDVALAPEAEWERDPDLGIELLASPVPGVDPGLLIPRFLYRRADRVYEYATLIAELAAGSASVAPGTLPSVSSR